MINREHTSPKRQDLVGKNEITFQLPPANDEEQANDIKKLTPPSSYPVVSTSPTTSRSNELKFITLRNNFNANKIQQPRDTFRSRNSYFVARNLLGKHFALKLRDIKIAKATAMVSICKYRVHGKIILTK